MQTVVIEHVSLDGVLQGPARTDEDTTGGFASGGWAAAAGADPRLAEAMGEHMTDGWSWLFGHRTYRDLLAHWNATGGPMADGLNGRLKRVATRHDRIETPWPNSEVLSGDVAARIAALRATPGGPMLVMGSSELVHAMLRAGQVDALLLFVHPVALGGGKRLFDDSGGPRRFTLTRATALESGVLITGYRAA